MTLDELSEADVLVTPFELAQMAAMHKRTLMKKIERGEIPSVRISKRKILIDSRSLTPTILAGLRSHSYDITEKRRAQCVYFIQAGAGPIKIGMARDPEARLVGLQTSHYEELRLLASVEGGLRAELRYHRRFAAHRLRGEWFAPHPDILAEIERLAIARTAQPAVRAA